MTDLPRTPKEHSIRSVSQEGRNIAIHLKRDGLKHFLNLHKRVSAHPEKYWSTIAESFHWFRKWHKVLLQKGIHAEWFVGGKTNITYNALDRHLSTRGNKAALIWESELGAVRTLTYVQLHQEVCKLSHSLVELGIKKGDVVAIYMGLVPEAAVAMLACARIGAIHTVVFGGFSSEALYDRLVDSKAKAIICADGVTRRGVVIDLKGAVDTALKKKTHVHSVVVLRHAENRIVMKKGRDHWWHECAKNITNFAAVPVESHHPLFYLYTSGSTGRPKGIVHSTGGYMVYAQSTFEYVFGPRESDIYWCTADVGWITGHTYVAYGPLLSGATVFLYEGALNHPDWGRAWSMIERHRISILYTAPTAIRSFIRAGNLWVTKHDLTSLRLLGSVGEPINPDVWMWFYTVVGKKRCPVVDTWWQTETGGIMIAPKSDMTVLKPGSATTPLPGIEVDVVRDDGTSCVPNEGGYLVITRPWPGMMKTILGDDMRYKKTYWSHISRAYFTGDSAKKDADGYVWIMGRVDDVVNVSGHRLGTAEVESALVSHVAVAEAAVVSRPDEIKGNALVAYIILKKSANKQPNLVKDLQNHVAKKIGSIAKPDDIYIVESLPKTRSGKIMRRLLRDRASGRVASGDISTLED